MLWASVTGSLSRTLWLPLAKPNRTSEATGPMMQFEAAESREPGEAESTRPAQGPGAAASTVLKVSGSPLGSALVALCSVPLDKTPRTACPPQYRQMGPVFSSVRVPTTKPNIGISGDVPGAELFYK